MSKPGFASLKTLLFSVSTIVLIFQNLGNVFGYFFQVALTYFLTKAQFGTFNTLFSISLFLATLAITMQLLVAQYIFKTRKDDQEQEILRIFQLGFYFTVIIILTTAISLDALKSTLKLTNELHPLLTGILVGTQFWAAVAAGGVQGLRQYTRFGIATGLIPFTRFVLLISSLALLQPSVSVTLVLCSVSNIFCIIICLRAVKRLPFYSKISSLKDLLRKLFGTHNIISLFVGTAFVMYFTTIDVVFVRVINTEVETGIYSAAALIARMIYLVPFALAQVLFSESLQDQANSKSIGPKLFQALAYTLIIAIPLVFVCSIFPEFVLTLFFNALYVEAAESLPYLAFAMMFLLLANSIFSVLLHGSKQSYLVLFVIMAIGFSGLVILLEASPKLIAQLLCISTFCLFLSLLSFFLYNNRNRDRG